MPIEKKIRTEERKNKAAKSIIAVASRYIFGILKPACRLDHGFNQRLSGGLYAPSIGIRKLFTAIFCKSIIVSAL